MTESIDIYRDSIKKLAHMYGMGVFVQFLMEAKGLDTTNQQMNNLQLLDSLRDQASLLASINNLLEHDDDDDYDDDEGSGL